MVEQTISQEGICFLPVTRLIVTIRKIERDFPGWWWSISQHIDSITITMGPTKHATIVSDILLAQTKFGDNGFAHSFYYKDQSSEDLFINWLFHLFGTMHIHRFAVSNGGNVEGIEILPHRRTQSEGDLLMLGETYTKFLNELPLYEKGGMVFDELYLGSCEHSVDCSFRGLISGKDASPKEAFDITWDISEGGFNIASSINECMEDIKKTIMLPAAETAVERESNEEMSSDTVSTLFEDWCKRNDI